MWVYNHTPALQHYGVKGMKWGVRKDRKSNFNSDDVILILLRENYTGYNERISTKVNPVYI